MKLAINPIFSKESKSRFNPFVCLLRDLRLCSLMHCVCRSQTFLVLRSFSLQYLVFFSPLLVLVHLSPLLYPLLSLFFVSIHISFLLYHSLRLYLSVSSSLGYLTFSSSSRCPSSCFFGRAPRALLVRGRGRVCRSRPGRARWGAGDGAPKADPPSPGR